MIGMRSAAAAEWIKLRSVRSSYLTAGSAVGLSVVFGALSARSAVHAWPTMTFADRASFDPFLTTLDGATWAEFILPVLGLLTMTSEYGTGMIRTSFLAVPRRLNLLAAKVAVVCALSLLLGELVIVTSLIVGAHILQSGHITMSVLSSDAVRAIAGGGAYVLVLSLVAIGLGALLRHTGAAVTAMFALLFLAYGFARALESWSHVPDRWLLVNIGESLTRLRPVRDPKVPTFAGALAELAVYAAVSVALACWRFSRDA
jgi:ABC-2 type transport system permease protein